MRPSKPEYESEPDGLDLDAMFQRLTYRVSAGALGSGATAAIQRARHRRVVRAGFSAALALAGVIGAIAVGGNLFLRSGPGSGEAGPTPIPSASPTQPSTLSPGELMQRSVPISGRLQQVLGQPTATMQQLMDISIHEENAGLRTEAIRAGMQAIDNAPDLRSSVLKSLEGADDSVLASMLRNVAQGRANEIISQVAATSRTPEIRTRGMQILRNLNTPTEPAETQ